MELRHYLTARGKDVFETWLVGLKDNRAEARIDARINRLTRGNFGDCKPVGGGVWELRIDYGPGYRVYYTMVGQTCVLLLCGGDKRKQLSFIFVDYKHGPNGLEILGETDPIPIEHISWDCLTIEAQGYGVIQMCDCRKVVEDQTKRDFYLGFLKAYDKYRLKELKKHEKFTARFIKDVDTINW